MAKRIGGAVAELPAGLYGGLVGGGWNCPFVFVMKRSQHDDHNMWQLVYSSSF